MLTKKIKFKNFREKKYSKKILNDFKQLLKEKILSLNLYPSHTNIAIARKSFLK